MKILVETMTKLSAGMNFIRVWREHAGLEEPDNSDLSETAERLADEGIVGQALALELLKLERVNAVEVLDYEGQGLVVYRLEDDGSF